VQHLTAAEKAIATNPVQIGTTAGTAYDGAQGLNASNLAYTASTNAEAARAIATNAQAVADAALPASSEPWTTNRYVADAPGSTFTNVLIWVGSTNNQTSTNAGTLYFTW
jgi:hypothetical protein